MRWFFVCILILSATSTALAQGVEELAAPQTRQDGWTTAGVESAKLTSAGLREMERAIQADEFKRITSVLIARQGKLIYEAYFGGSARRAL